MLKGCKFIGTLLFFLSSSIAFGHAFPEKENPGAGDVISSKATNISIIFNSHIEPVFSTLRVSNVRNEQVSKGKGSVNIKNHYLLETQIPSLPPGEYQVTWNVIAIDGHNTHGSYTFTIK